MKSGTKRKRTAVPRLRDPAGVWHVDVLIKDRQWLKVRGIRSLVRRACLAALSDIRDSGEICIVLAGDAGVRKLNREWRGKDKPTNVLSFAGTPPLLGDIVLARQTVLREARDRAKPVAHHIVHLVVHGCLHLLGYDHEEEKEARRMEKMEINLLEQLGIPNPYLLRPGKPPMVAR